MQTDSCTLLVWHLSKFASSDNTRNLFFQLGACRVWLMSQAGRLCHCAFATFPSVSSARRVLQLLHQHPVAARRLCVKFAQKSVHSHVESDTMASKYFNCLQNNVNNVRDPSLLTLQSNSVAPYQQCSDTACELKACIADEASQYFPICCKIFAQS